MKSFRQFMEQPEVINMMKNFAKQNEKSPQELKGMRDKVIGGVARNLGKKIDYEGMIKKIPDSNEMSTGFKKAKTGLTNMLRDPNTQQKFNNIGRMLDSLIKK